ncbi:hypothetical protein Salat_1450600 [Sesamum alatum]|uniref:Uncharacterized protein n=1 Tax=Sesamum alatum TaxID=300844 RepID=A0AAE1YAS1_9LAMI|nr:hypothetical protein Salat_1450600 [Sesamum alatum]
MVAHYVLLDYFQYLVGIVYVAKLEKSTTVAENVSEAYSEKSRTENISGTYLERANAGENVSMACLESVALETKRTSVVENVYEADSEGVAPETKRVKLPRGYPFSFSLQLFHLLPEVVV